MGFDNKPAVVIKTDMNKRVVVSDSIAVYSEHNSVTGMDGDKVVVSSGDNRYTRLENGKLTYEGDGQVREFNLPTTKGQGTYTLATIDDYPIYDPQDQLFISLTGEENTFYKNVDLSTAPGRMFYVNLSALNPVFKDGLTSTYNDMTNQLEVSLNAVIPTKTSDLFNDSGYVTETWVQNQGYATSSSLATVATTGNYNDLTDKPTFATVATSGSYNDLTDKPDLSIYAESANLSTVATSGSYNDLTDKPAIPDAVSGTNDGTNWTTLTIGNSTYDIPQGGSTPGMIGEVLYDVPNGEAGVNPITMAHSFADYSYVDIQYRCYDNAYEVRSQRIYDPNGKHVYLDWDVLVNGTVYAKKSIYILNGTTMTVKDNTDMQVWYSNGSNVQTQVTPTADYQHQIKITKVVGYKQNSSAPIVPVLETGTLTKGAGVNGNN